MVSSDPLLHRRPTGGPDAPLRHDAQHRVAHSFDALELEGHLLPKPEPILVEASNALVSRVRLGLRPVLDRTHVEDDIMGIELLQEPVELPCAQTLERDWLTGEASQNLRTTSSP